jgi:hypothetical protein
MINIIYSPIEYERIKTRFTCSCCGCIWDADKNDFTLITPDSYFSTCPICGATRQYTENQVEHYKYIDYNDGTMSIIKEEKSNEK